MKPSAAHDLVLARNLLLAPDHGTRRMSAKALREALAELYEFWLTTHASSIEIGRNGSGVALLAIGALGRREMVPASDLDLVLVHDGREEINEIATKLWYPLWDSGIGLDHSVRTLGEMESAMRKDLRVALGLLDARMLAGDQDIADLVITMVHDQWRSGITRRLPELMESATKRWDSAGEVAHRIEPDLKHGHGGLRDVQLIKALSVAQVAERPSPTVLDSYALLLDIRTELRRITRRGRDVVYAQYGDEIATMLGIGDRFGLARALSAAGRTIAYATQVALRSAEAAMPRRGFVFGRRASPRRPLDDGVVLHGNEVALAKNAMPSRDPALLLRVAAAAARMNAPIASGTLTRLADSAPELRKPWPTEAKDELLRLLGSGSGLADVIEALDRTGLWGRLFPEWGAVRDLPPRELVHTWTVDRHLVQATMHAARLATSVSRPDLLLLTALLHDIGKGRDTDHSEIGAVIAAQIAERIGLWPTDIELVSLAVRHHLLLPHTATRRDIDDPATITRVVDTLAGNVVLLDLLAALAQADGMATGSGMWTEWKSELISDLVARCRAAMAGEPMIQPEPLDKAQRSLADKVAQSRQPDVLVTQEGHTATITVIAPDVPGLLSKAAGALALHSLEVHAASVRGYADVAVDTFTVSPRFGSFPDPLLIREQILLAVNGSLPLAERLASKERDYSTSTQGTPTPKIRWFDSEATAGVILELRAVDRIGLLHDVASSLEACSLDIRWAKVATLGNTVVDSFCVTTKDGGPLLPRQRQHVEQTVLVTVG